MGASASVDLQSGDLSKVAEEGNCGDALRKFEGLDDIDQARVGVHICDAVIEKLASDEDVRAKMRAGLREFTATFVEGWWARVLFFNCVLLFDALILC